ncbi:MAG: hypothetical protein WD751_05095 [Anaerolineales bacterium]
MEKEQLEKKVEWLDAERRKAIEAVTALEKRLAALEKSQPKPTTSTKSLTSYKARLDSIAESLGELEKQLKSQQSASKKELQEIDKQNKQLEKSIQQDQKKLNAVLEDFRKEIGQLQALQKASNDQATQLIQLTGKTDKLYETIQALVAGEQTRGQLAKSLEQASQEDARRLAEMRAEVSALLTRLESAASQTELVNITVRKMEKRIEEVVKSEEERKTDQDEFLQEAALGQTDREHQWKDWGLRFEVIEKQSAEVADRLKEFDNTELALKRAQQAFDELVEKINRRVSELGEMQRLGDQRFRQEWSTFLTDSQKRWSNFTLTSEEQQREALRLREKLAERVTQLEDALREVQDNLQHLSEQHERNLQSVLEMARDSLAENERFLSSNSK